MTHHAIVERVDVHEHRGDGVDRRQPLNCQLSSRHNYSPGQLEKSHLHVLSVDDEASRRPGRDRQRQQLSETIKGETYMSLISR